MTAELVGVGLGDNVRIWDRVGIRVEVTIGVRLHEMPKFSFACHSARNGLYPFITFYFFRLTAMYRSKDSQMI